MPKNDQNFELKSRIEKYKDVEGTSTKELDFGLWFVANKHKFRLALIYCLLLIAVASWLVTLYSFTYYVFWGMKQDELIIKQMVETNVINHDYAKQKSPQNLTFSNVEIVRSSGKNYDFLARINNSNADWRGEFDYYFLFEGQKSGEGKSFILPDETKYLTAFNQSLSLGSDVKLIIENMQWARIDKHKIPDWQDYKNKRLNVVIKDIQFTAADNNSADNINQLVFTAINKTAYNYREADFIAVLSSGSRVVGVNKYKFSDFLSNEERQFRGNWIGNYGRVQVEIIPEINIMDGGNYKKFEL